MDVYRHYARTLSPRCPYSAIPWPYIRQLLFGGRGKKEMKGKRVKRAHKFMHAVYERCFGHRVPYQLLLDAGFISSCLQQKIVFKEILPTLLGGQVRLMVTQCVLDELRSLDPSALFNAKRLELRRCSHRHGTGGSECILDVVGEDNPHHYGVAGGCPELRSSLRMIPGVPVVLLNRGIMVMEAPSEATLCRAKDLNGSKLKVDAKEKKAIDIIAPAPASSEGASKKKKRRLGGPNPLSCKKPASKNRKKDDAKPQRRHRSKIH